MKQTQLQKFLGWLRHYSIYYIVKLFTNVFLLSVYVIVVASPHVSCRTKSGINVTEHFDFAFSLGIVVLSMDAFNAAVPCLYFRAKMARLRLYEKEDDMLYSDMEIPKIKRESTSLLQEQIKVKNG